MPSRPHNAYSLVGVPLTANTEEIQAAYEHKVAESQNEPGDFLLALQVARDCLTDPTSRCRYDARAGVVEPRRKSPKMKVMSPEEVKAEKQAELDAKAEFKARNSKKRVGLPADAERFNKARESRTLDKLDEMLGEILKR